MSLFRSIAQIFRMPLSFALQRSEKSSSEIPLVDPVPAKPYYQRTIEERIALTELAIQERRTLMERWSVLNDAEGSHWNLRSQIAAELLYDQDSIAEFGCGMMYLEKYLRPEQVYVPSDVAIRDSRTAVCDLNTQDVPNLGVTSICFLGVFEYLHDVQHVLSSSAQKYDVMVASYCVTDAPDAPADRRQHAWVNDFSTPVLEGMLQAAGWQIEEMRTVDTWQKMWRLRSVVRSAAAFGSPGAITP